jgi:hypothetical protein
MGFDRGLRPKLYPVALPVAIGHMANASRFEDAAADLPAGRMEMMP